MEIILANAVVLYITVSNKVFHFNVLLIFFKLDIYLVAPPDITVASPNKTVAPPNKTNKGI